MIRNGSGNGGKVSESSAGLAATANAEQAALEAAAACLHVLGPTATHTNATAGSARHRSDALGSGGLAFEEASSSDPSSSKVFHWRSGARDATEGALFAACRALVRHALRHYHGQDACGSGGGGDLAFSTRVCQEVAVGAARVAGGGLSALLKSGGGGSLFSASMSRSSLADDKSPSGSALRALRATLAALMPAEDANNLSSFDDTAARGDGGEGLEDEGGVGVSMSAALQAGAVAAYTTALFKGQSAAQAVGITQRVLIEGANVAPEAAKTLAMTMRDPNIASAAARVKDKEVDASLEPMLASLPSDEAREGVKQLLKMTKEQVNQLPPEQRLQVEQIRGMYQQHRDFAKQSADAAKQRAGRAERNQARRKRATVRLARLAEAVTLRSSKRRNDEIKWLREFSEKNEKVLAAAATAAAERNAESEQRI